MVSASFAALFMLAACSESTGPTTPVATYTLSSVANKALPAVMYADTGYTVEVTAGTITLTADNKYTSSITTRETVDGKASVYVDNGSGTWVQNSASGEITITASTGAIYSATWSGTRLTITDTDIVYVYSSSR